jgi:hypothetical protein
MKIKSLLPHLGLFSSIILPSSVHALDVHEWGTFTVLVSSQGQTVDWYQPYSDITKLPGFVMINNMQMMKSFAPAARVRMETPVIYFYPEEETTVSVRVAFDKGRITERFPASTDMPFSVSGIRPNPFSLISSAHQNLSCVAVHPTSERLFDQRMLEQTVSVSPSVVRWTGKLLPPDHEDAKLIPTATPQQGENYAAARNVPDAWIFHSDVPNKMTPLIHPVEKFIFYRGAGESMPPYIASMPNDNSVSFVNQSQSASTFQIALRVRDGRATWKQMPNISGPMADSSRISTVTLPEATMTLEQADQELSALFLAELISRGLTKAEAQAMIDTWNHTWFAEPGQRVFTIVDRTWVDSVLPLGITPEPKKIERVFVARYEILSPETEQKLADVLEAPASEERNRAFASLELGRFSKGAAELVADRKKHQTLNQFHQLQAEHIRAQVKP